MSLHTSVSALAEQRGMTPTARIKAGDIVQLVWQRKRIYARVLSWSGNDDAHVRCIDLRCQVHRRYVDSLSRDIPTAELPELEKRFEELLHSKRGKAAAHPPVASDWGPESGGGSPQRCDVPLVLRDKAHAAWPAPRLISHVSRLSDRQLLTLSERRPPADIVNAEWEALRPQWRLRQALGEPQMVA